MEEDNQLTKNGNRRHAGMFKPGVSGNPAGRPKTELTIRDLARQHTEEAINTLLEITRSRSAPQSARVHAACALLDRGWGKPTQFLEAIHMELTLEDYLIHLANEDSDDSDEPNLLTLDV
jgi:hypothetical protein